MRSAVSTLLRLFAADVRQVATEAMTSRRGPVSVTLNGVVLPLGPWASPGIRKALDLGHYESPERDIVLATLRPCDVVLELGSGSGYITTIAAGVASEVRSYDANPELVAAARATVARNGRNAIIENGVLSHGAQGDTVAFYVAPNFLESSLLPIDGARVVEVPVLAFAKALEGISYLIVDIEGAEVDLLREDLLAVERVCVECHPQVVGIAAIAEMLHSLCQQGFELESDISQGQVVYMQRRGGDAAGSQGSTATGTGVTPRTQGYGSRVDDE